MERKCFSRSKKAHFLKNLWMLIVRDNQYYLIKIHFSFLNEILIHRYNQQM